MTSENLSRVVVGVATTVIILALSFIYSWPMTLVMTVIVPLLVGCNFMHIKNMRGQVNAKTSNSADAAAGSLLSEAIDAIRTVASFGMGQLLTAKYWMAQTSRTSEQVSREAPPLVCCRAYCSSRSLLSSMLVATGSQRERSTSTISLRSSRSS